MSAVAESVAMAANAEKLALPAADPSTYEDVAIAWATELSDLLIGRMSDGWAARCSSLTWSMVQMNSAKGPRSILTRSPLSMSHTFRKTPCLSHLC